MEELKGRKIIIAGSTGFIGADLGNCWTASLYFKILNIDPLSPRAVAGCLATSVLISPWLIICAFLLALFLTILEGV